MRTPSAELSPSGKGRSGWLAEAAYLGSTVTGDLRDAPRLLEQGRRAHPGPGGPLSAAVAGAYHLLHVDVDVDTAHRLLVTAIYELDDPRDAHNKVLIEALYTLIMICFFGGRADLWPLLQNTVDRLIPRPPELLAILSATFSDPARLTPAMLARADASVAGLGQQVSPARITRHHLPRRPPRRTRRYVSVAGICLSGVVMRKVEPATAGWPAAGSASPP